MPQLDALPYISEYMWMGIGIIAIEILIIGGIIRDMQIHGEIVNMQFTISEESSSYVGYANSLSIDGSTLGKIYNILTIRNPKVKGKLRTIKLVSSTSSVEQSKSPVFATPTKSSPSEAPVSATPTKLSTKDKGVKVTTKSSTKSSTKSKSTPRSRSKKE